MHPDLAVGEATAIGSNWRASSGVSNDLIASLAHRTALIVIASGVIAVEHQHLRNAQAHDRIMLKIFELRSF